MLPFSLQNSLENEQCALLWKLLGSPTQLATGHSRQPLRSSILHKCPFLSPTNPSIFLNIYSDEKGRRTCTSTYIKNTCIPISCSILLGKKKRKSQRGRAVQRGRATSQHTSRSCKAWPTLSRGTMASHIARPAKGLCAPTSPQKPQ